MTSRSFQLEFFLTTAKQPIIIPTKDLNKALSTLKEIINKFESRIVQTLPYDQNIQVTFSLKKKNEEAFLTQLKTIGQLQMEQEGFQDDAGNMVVILKLR